MKEGDIVMAFGDPIRLRIPLGQVRLIKKLGDYGRVEEWNIEYLNSPGHYYNLMLHKPDVPIGNGEQ